jgi:hypothetical protein
MIGSREAERLAPLLGRRLRRLCAVDQDQVAGAGLPPHVPPAGLACPADVAVARRIETEKGAEPDVRYARAGIESYHVSSSPAGVALPSECYQVIHQLRDLLRTLQLHLD